MVRVFFATLAEFEQDMIREAYYQPGSLPPPRAVAVWVAVSSLPFQGTRVRLAQAAMAQRDHVRLRHLKLGIRRVTLYRYVGPKAELRDYSKRVLGLASDSAMNAKRPLFRRAVFPSKDAASVWCSDVGANMHCQSQQRHQPRLPRL